MASDFKDEGDIAVLTAIGEHAEHASSGTLSPHRPWLIALGGGLRGIYGAAAATQLEAAALTEGFAGCAGVSTGAATCAYFLSKQGALGTTFYYEECVGKNFFTPWRVLVGASGIDVAFLARAMRGAVGLKKLNADRVLASKAEFFVAVTDAQTGIGELLDAKAVKPDIVTAIEASIAIPDVYRKSVTIGANRYVDGGVGMPFPAREVIQRFKPTHILVLANRPPVLVSPRWYNIVTMIFAPLSPRFVRRSSSGYDRIMSEELDYLRASKIPYLIIWTTETVTAFTQDKQKIRAGMASARTHMRSLLERAGL